MKLKIVDASFHRNGISGEGFYAIIFDDLEEKKRMIASLFDAPGHCAVYAIDELVKNNIAFANGNSWRGDYYENDLRKLVQTFLKKHGTNRLGPFALPGIKE